MAANDVMFNIKIGLQNLDEINTKTQAVVTDLQDTLNKHGITVPVSLNNATLKQMDQFIQSIGGSMKVTKDELTGFINSITVDVPKANGQIVNIKQSVDAFTTSVTNANGATTQVLQGFTTSGITATVNGMNDTFQRVKQVQDQIVASVQKQKDLEYQLATAIQNGDSKQVAALTKKIEANTQISNMAKDQLSTMNTQAHQLGLQVDYFDNVNQRIAQIDTNTASWVQSTIAQNQQFLQLSQTLNQDEKAITNFANAYIKAMSANGGDYQQMLLQNLDNLRPALDNVRQSMENLGVTFDEAGAHYSGNNTALQQLTQTYNKATRQIEEFNAKQSDQRGDVQIIEQTVQAYKAYRDQLDKIYKIKKENDTSADLKTEMAELNRLEAAYKQLEQSILSNGEAVYKNTQYNRDKNQVTRDSIQAQHALNATMQDNTLSDLIADTIMYKVSLQELYQVIQNVITETISLNDSMTQIRLVTQGSAEETKQLMSDYSQIAKELGTTTTAVAESATEWLNFIGHYKFH